MNLSLETICKEQCIFTLETIGSRVKTFERKGLPFVLGLLKEASRHTLYVSALELTKYFNSNTCHPISRSTDFTVQYLWNLRDRKEFAVLPETSEGTTKVPLQLEHSVLACNHETSDIRVENIIAMLVNVKAEEHECWTKLLINEFVKEIGRSKPPVFERHHKKLAQVYADTKIQALLPCLYVCNRETMQSPFTETFFDGVLANNPSDEIALTVKALLYIEEKNFEKGRIAIETVLKYHPKNLFANSWLAEQYYAGTNGSVSNDAKSLLHAKIALKQNPANAHLHLRVGSIYNGGRDGVNIDRKKAVKHLEHTLKANPNNSLVHYELGILYSRGGYGVDTNRERAIAHLLQAVELDPKDDESHAVLGEEYRRLRDMKEAVFHLGKAINLNPKNWFAYGSIGAIYRTGGNGIEKNYHNAINMLTEAVRLNPDYLFAHMQLGYLYKNGSDHFTPDYRKAKLHLKKACILDPNDAGIRFELGLLYAHGGYGLNQDYKKAHKYVTPFCSIKPSAFSCVCLGDIYRMLDKGKKALTHLLKAIELDPNYYDAHLALGELFRLGSNGVEQDLASAHEHLTKALNIDPLDFRAHRSLGAVLWGWEKFDEAENYILKALELNPTDTRTRELLDMMRRNNNIESVVKHLNDVKL